MKIVGITGGAGSGKSHVCRLIAEHFAYPVIDSDTVTRELMTAGSPMLQSIAQEFGTEFLLADGNLNRAKMAALVFHDEAALARLNALTHPATIAEIVRLLKRYEEEGYRAAVVESALADKADYRSFCDELWLVAASEQTRAERLRRQRGYSPERIRELMERQSTQEQFASACRRTVVNEADTDDEELLRQLRVLFSDLENGTGTDFVIRIAGRSIAVHAQYASTRSFCRDYLTGDEPELTVTVSRSDIDYEREKSAREDAAEGIPVRRFSDAYLETLAVYRKIAAGLLAYDTLLFHGSVVAVDGAAYLFTAKSGTGKSTHTRLWREVFGDRAVMVNDDKPLIRLDADGATVCGTPWNGKHRIGSNIAVPLKAICILERGAQNRIVPITFSEALPMLLQQVYRPSEPEPLQRTLALTERLGGCVGLYRMNCNMEPSAARTAYEGMKEKIQ